MNIEESTCITFCISPNAKWVAVACSNRNVVGLFSTISTSLVWKIELSLCWYHYPNTIPLEFDRSGTKLIAKTGTALYAFAPTCLIEDCFMDFECSSYTFDLTSSTSLLKAKAHHHKLLTKDVLLRLMDWQERLAMRDSGLKNLDAATSATTDKIALLTKNNQGHYVVYGFLAQSYLRGVNKIFGTEIAPIIFLVVCVLCNLMIAPMRSI